MSGIELEGDTLRVDREPNALDQLALDVSSVLSSVGVDHVLVAGYVAILTGRPRGTEDIDVLIERLDPGETERLADALKQAGFWGSAMPLDEMHTTLSEGTNVRVARDGEVVPNVEVKFVEDRFDRASLENSLTATIGSGELPVGPLELQIAYKLYLDTQKDFEDAVHLYATFVESLSTSRLEEWIETLGVEDDYDRLRRT